MQNKKTNGSTSLFNLKKALIACALLLGISWGAKAQIITTIAGGGVGDGGQATAASLDYDNYIAKDRFGNLYISDYNNYRIRKVAANGIILP